MWPLGIIILVSSYFHTKCSSLGQASSASSYITNVKKSIFQVLIWVLSVSCSLNLEMVSYNVILFINSWQKGIYSGVWFEIYCCHIKLTFHCAPLPLYIIILRKQPTFRDGTGFPEKWCQRNEHRNHFPDLDRASDWLEICFIQSEAVPR